MFTASIASEFCSAMALNADRAAFSNLDVSFASAPVPVDGAALRD
jgi:hypothetical protein